MKVIAIDCESNGLHGKTFCIAAVIMEDGQETNTFIGRCPIGSTVNQWVDKNVLPKMTDIPISYVSYDELCSEYDSWYQSNKEDAIVVAHIGWPVEARFLLDAHPTPFTGPFPLEDTAPLLRGAGYDPTSEIDYVKAVKIELPNGEQHNPLFDARLTAKVYTHLMNSVNV